jgi:phosphatidate cytidylyltransferase
LALAGIFGTDVQGFYWFVGAIVAVAAWEWARLSGYERQSLRVSYAVYVAIWLIFVRYIPATPILYVGLAWWLIAIVLVLRYPGTSRFWRQRSVKLGIGLLILIPFWKTMLALREAQMLVDIDLGVHLVLFYALLLIWAADTGAYFAGRAFGKAKLAPAVSPGKSWAGAWGGLGCTVVLALVAAFWLDLSSALTIQLVVVTVIAAIVSIFGDLTESLFKREAGIKDSSNLLPGHGGVLDRIDSLTASIPVLTALLYSFSWIAWGNP